MHVRDKTLEKYLQKKPNKKAPSSEYMNLIYQLRSETPLARHLLNRGHINEESFKAGLKYAMSKATPLSSLGGRASFSVSSPPTSPFSSPPKSNLTPPSSPIRTPVRQPIITFDDDIFTTTTTTTQQTSPSPVKMDVLPNKQMRYEFSILDDDLNEVSSYKFTTVKQAYDFLKEKHPDVLGSKSEKTFSSKLSADRWNSEGIFLSKKLMAKNLVKKGTLNRVFDYGGTKYSSVDTLYKSIPEPQKTYNRNSLLKELQTGGIKGISIQQLVRKSEI